MLDSATKNKINAARDILVGKIPDPKGQIDQITNALIYKFMDDQDQESISIGGVATHFVGDLTKYAWHNLFDPKLDNQERSDLYREGLDKLAVSSTLPEFFRDVFKNTYLPFRDAGTISMFIKQINEFEYRSEELGNAFEYLLQIMGSQGDAGQFRTPRNIIEFIVNIIDPTKSDKILDPACGTAGFLIESYKHIKETGNLSQSDRKGLADNLTGVDIDPGMAKIARVNLYLHGFTSPKITEDDTLSNESLWLKEKFDVILANPPFMTPKGGITPHKKFSISSNRAEVLFVDYIAEHLKLNGRAGIIVPEGIIFHSGTAYKSLRKKLVDEGYLHAVISLPSGVFQPYSGVKTSILVLDRQKARESENILFIKIQNDGYDLGAQRREITKNDLPEALEIYVTATTASPSPNDNGVDFTLVPKSKIAQTPDYNLSGDRYKTATDYTNAKWPMIELGEVCDILDNKRRPITKSDREIGEYPYYGATGILDYVKDYIFSERLVLIGEDGAKWGVGDKTAFIAEGKYWVNNHAHVLRPDKTKLKDVLLVELINNMDLSPFITGVTVPKLNQEKLRGIKIPIPPLHIQEEIVAEIDGYQKIIRGAKEVVENWKPRILVDAGWEVKKVSEISKLEYGIGESAQESGEFRYVRISDIDVNGELKNKEKKYIAETEESKKYLLKKGDVLVARTGATFGKTVYFEEEEKSVFAGFLIRINLNENEVNSKYFWCFAQSENYWNQAKSLMTGGGQPQFNANAVGKIKIPLPPLEIQQKIVHQIESERVLVEGNKKLIEIYEGKVREAIGRVWGD
jgi:type I restriction enzyme M protein